MTNSSHINVTSSLLPGLDKPNRLSIEKMMERGGVSGVTRDSVSAPVAADSTSLSGVSSTLAAALTSDDVRTDRVGALQATINDGSYQVPSSAVADKIIDTMSRD